MDLYISAQAFEPEHAAENNYTEKLVMLPALGVYVEPLQLPNTDPDLKSLQLPADQPLLLCPGQPFKYAPQYDDVWVRIAKGLQTRGFFRKGSAGRLVFFRSHSETFDRILEERLRAAFARGGARLRCAREHSALSYHARFFGVMRKSITTLDTLAFSCSQYRTSGYRMRVTRVGIRRRLPARQARERYPPRTRTCPSSSRQTQMISYKRLENSRRNPEKLRELRAKIIQSAAPGCFESSVLVRALERRLIEAGRPE